MGDLGLDEKLRYDIKRMTHKRKTMDFVKINNFFYAKDLVKIMKGKYRDWEKIFAEHISDKRTVFLFGFFRIPEPIVCVCIKIYITTYTYICVCVYV